MSTWSASCAERFGRNPNEHDEKSACRGRDGPCVIGSARPPHRSQRAGLPHWALALGVGVEIAAQARDAGCVALVAIEPQGASSVPR